MSPFTIFLSALQQNDTQKTVLKSRFNNFQSSFKASTVLCEESRRFCQLIIVFIILIQSPTLTAGIKREPV